MRQLGPTAKVAFSCDDQLGVGKANCIREMAHMMISEVSYRFRITGLECGEKSLRLAAKMLKIGASRKFLLHISSMRFARDPLTGHTKVYEKGGIVEGGLNPSRGSGGAPSALH
jgi:hypothetical protein